MLSNYFKMFLRSLRKHKLYSFINITGLAVGMASGILILEYVFNEFSFDSFWKNSDNIYRIRHDQYQNGELQFASARTFSGIGEAALNEIPGVKNCTKFYKDEVMCYTDENKVRLSNQNLYWVDTTFLDVFDLRFIHGSSETAFTNFYSTIISQSAAQKLFGIENPIGKWYKVNEGWAFCVTGVFKDIPENSHINMDFIVSSASLWFYITNWDNETGRLRPVLNNPGAPAHYSNRWQWFGADAYTYVSLSSKSDVKQIENKLSALFNKYAQEIIHNGGKVKLSLQNIKDIHLTSNLQFELNVNGDKTLTVALLITAIIILLIAWVNYVNLSIVKSMDRSKETALRKVVGADRFQLIWQYLSESVLMNITAIVLAIILAGVVIFMFQDLSDNYINNGFFNSGFWIIIAAFLFTGTMLSGIYPAFVLSSFKPLELLKEKSSGFSSNTGIRKLLVGFQFIVAIILISVTLVVYLQIDFMQNQKLGCSIDQVLFMRSPYTMIKKPQRLERLQSFKNEIKRISGVKDAATSSSIPGEEITWHRDDVRRAGSNPTQKSDYSFLNIDEDFIRTYKLNLLSGRNFQTDNDRQSVIINEQAAKQLGFKNSQNAVNELMQAGDSQFRIIGVIKDYHHQYLKKAVAPTMFFYGFNWNLDVGYYSLKINSSNLKTTITEIEKVWKNIYPEDPFDYFFLDDQYGKQYKADIQFGKIFSLFSFLSICLTFFGLFGLTSYTFIKRTKEIGIRKVLGGSVTAILFLLIKDIIRWIIIANLIAIPVAWFAIDSWLQNFAYSIRLSWWIFAASGVIALLIALATVSIQAVKAATANPVEALKYE